MLASFDRAIEEHGFEVAVGSSGTIEQVLRLARGLAGEDPLRTLNGAVLTRKQVITPWSRRSSRPGAAGTTDDLADLDPKRADIILAGALVLEGVVKRFGIKELLISEYALREGVFLDTVARQRGGSLPHLRDVARRSVIDLMLACDEDPVHSEHVAAWRSSSATPPPTATGSAPMPGHSWRRGRCSPTSAWSSRTASTTSTATT